MRREKLAAILVAAVAPSSAFAQYTPITLASFNGGTDGANPVCDLLLSGSTLYGTTELGGPSGGGGVFSLPVTGGTPTLLGSFNNGNNGSGPIAGLVLSGSTLYGTTAYGGPDSAGEVFSLPISGGTPTVVASFNGGSNGGTPGPGDLILSGSTLYGTTEGGGVYGYGEVYSVPTSGGTPTVLASFNGGSTSGYPYAGLLRSGSTLYGTVAGAGTQYGAGAVFSASATGGNPTLPATFNGGSNGSNPVAGLILSGTTLYGTTLAGGAYAHGGIFSVPITGGTITMLASFNGTDGSECESDLILSGSTLYGTTVAGGAYGDGEVFSLPTTGGTPTVLLSFDGTNGESPNGALIMDANGNLYGTTTLGGVYGDGTVFELVVPEPSTASLLAISSLALIRRTRRVKR